MVQGFWIQISNRTGVLDSNFKWGRILDSNFISLSGIQILKQLSGIHFSNRQGCWIQNRWEIGGILDSDLGLQVRWTKRDAFCTELCSLIYEEFDGISATFFTHTLSYMKKCWKRLLTLSSVLGYFWTPEGISAPACMCIPLNLGSKSTLHQHLRDNFFAYKIGLSFTYMISHMKNRLEKDFSSFFVYEVIRIKRVTFGPSHTGPYLWREVTLKTS